MWKGVQIFSTGYQLEKIEEQSTIPIHVQNLILEGYRSRKTNNFNFLLPDV